MMRRAAIALLLVLLACALPAGSAKAMAAPQHDSVATAIVETDAGSEFDFAWAISRQNGGDVVDQLNAAHALARCLDCRATAVAFQVVVVSGSPSTVTPRNIAEALNVECTSCLAVAEARQFVRVVAEPARFTRDGRRELADVRNDLRAAVRDQLPALALHEAVEQAEARVRRVLADELVTRSDPDTEADVLDADLLQSTDRG